MKGRSATPCRDDESAEDVTNRLSNVMLRPVTLQLRSGHTVPTAGLSPLPNQCALSSHALPRHIFHRFHPTALSKKPVQLPLRERRLHSVLAYRFSRRHMFFPWNPQLYHLATFIFVRLKPTPTMCFDKEEVGGPVEETKAWRTKGSSWL